MKFRYSKKSAYFFMALLIPSGTFPVSDPFKTMSTFFIDSAYCVRFIAKKIFKSHKDSCEYGITIDKKSIPDAHTIGTDIAALHAKAGRPHSFLVGASTSEHQSSTRCNSDICSWSRYAQEHGLPQPHDRENMLNIADHYEDYFKQAAAMGLTSIRFSVEWAFIEPQEGQFNQKELDRYAAMTLAALHYNITPVICLHHYTDPCWFLDRGGFETEKNIPYFVRFCTKVYETVMTAIDSNDEICQKLAERHPIMWATFNNPSGYAFRSYFTNNGPPSSPHKKGLKWVSKVIKNMMESHVRVYQALNNCYNQNPRSFPKPYIGFLKNMVLLDPSTKTIPHVIAYPLSYMAGTVADMVANDAIFTFFRKGIFSIKIPTQVSITHRNKKAPESLDFIGVNVYSNVLVALSQQLPDTNPETSTDNKQYRIYPESLYRALSIVSRELATPLSIPMYITENGIATKDNAKRTRFYQQYMKSLHKALQDGFDVRGYLTWTLADNYEWPDKSRAEKEYGICSVDPEDNSLLHPKPGSEWLFSMAKSVCS